MEHEEFNFGCQDMGEIDPLQADWEVAEDRASKVWTIPFRKRVRFKLEGILKEFEGVIRLARRPKVWDPHHQLELRLENMPFSNHEIESCTVIE